LNWLFYTLVECDIESDVGVNILVEQPKICWWNDRFCSSLFSQESLESFSANSNRPRTGVPSYRSPRKLPKLIGGRSPNVEFSEQNPNPNEAKMEEPLIEQVSFYFLKYFLTQRRMKLFHVFPTSNKFQPILQNSFD
jgi:hypothetical protein